MGGSVRCKRRVYASSKSGAQRIILSSFVLPRQKRTERKEAWAGRSAAAFFSGGERE